MTPKLILIADDEQDNRIIFSTILMHHGYNVFLATNGKEAVEQATRHAPDLILMDIRMPLMDGCEATNLLKAEPRTASIPIVALTAQDWSTGSIRERGFCAYVRKPVAPSFLLKAVSLCLESVCEEHPWVEFSPEGATLHPLV